MGEILEYPEAASIQAAFARLPKRGQIELLCRWERRLEMQRVLVEMGAFALTLEPVEHFRNIRLTALKGKSGACFETGRSATYAGAAAAAMDDDHHLIVGTLRVCEKTGGLYRLPPYHGRLVVTEGDAELLARLDSDPVPFDCNTFERDAERLAGRTFGTVAEGAPTTPVFYPGPFSLLVLRDGSILRRGHCARIASEEARDLMERDGLLVAPPETVTDSDRPIHYPTVYRSLGSACLLEMAVAPSEVPDQGGSVPLSEQTLEALGLASAPLRRRILRLIAEQQPYFVLTGSDPKDAQGCCPSTEVGEANRLVDAGVLSVHREATTGDICTVGLYALAGEVAVRDGQPVFAANVANRRIVAAALSSVGKRLGVRRAVVRGALLLLATASFVLAGRQALASLRHATDGLHAALARAVGASADDDRLFVCLFRNGRTCSSCESMGQRCRQILDGEFGSEVRAGHLVFREVAVDASENRAIRDELMLFTSAVGLVRYVDGQSRPVRLLMPGAESQWVPQLRTNLVSLLAEAP